VASEKIHLDTYIACRDQVLATLNRADLGADKAGEYAELVFNLIYGLENESSKDIQYVLRAVYRKFGLTFARKSIADYNFKTFKTK
jgi:hypothetical protein